MTDLRFAVLYGLTFFVPAILAWFGGRYWALAHSAGLVPGWTAIPLLLLAGALGLAGHFCRKALWER